jgi:hypothetical protein
MFINPEVKVLQKRANQVYKEFNIEDNVQCHFNYTIATINSNFNSWKQQINIIFSLSREQLADLIYSSFNLANNLQ